MSRHPPPSWSPYAEQILRRLSFTVTLQDDGRNDYDRDRVRTAPEAESLPDAVQEPPPAAEALAEAEPPPEGGDPLGLDDLGLDDDPDAKSGDAAEDWPQPSTMQVSLALRLAATFGSADAFLGCLAPGAITVLGGVRPDEVRTVGEVLRLAFFPPGCRIGSKPSHVRYSSRRDRPAVLQLAPDTGSDGISGYEKRRLHSRIAEALELGVPVLILQPDEAAADPDLARYLPTPVRLAAVDRGIMLHHLRLAYAGDIDTDVLLDALPPNTALAGLQDIALQVSLRAPDAMEAVRRLTEFLAVRKEAAAKGPRLEDIAGDSEALAAARQLVADLALWRQRQLAWSDLCRSLLLHGRPGTGKTWLARAMGNSADVGFIAASFAEWQAAGHLGNMLSAMRHSFAEARRQAPSILFIDEIDAVGSREDGDRHASNYRMQVINGFLEQMDSISREEGVIVVGACNHPDRIDPAVLRAGRFDLKIEVPLPDTAAILGILRGHLGAAVGEEELRDLARIATGSSAAEVDAAIRKARALARAARRELQFEDLRAQFDAGDAADEVWARRTAVHECGHAIVGAVLGCGEVVRVGLSDSGGTTTRRLTQQQNLLEDFEDELACGLAGRAAERMVFGDVCGGSGGREESDLARVTKLAVSIDTLFGLGVHGPLWIDTPPEVILRDPEARVRIRARLEEAEKRAGGILALHRQHLEAMAEVLARERLLAGEALAAWLAPVKAARKDGAETGTLAGAGPTGATEEIPAGTSCHQTPAHGAAPTPRNPSP